jgi:hypothetical protein
MYGMSRIGRLGGGYKGGKKSLEAGFTSHLLKSTNPTSRMVPSLGEKGASQAYGNHDTGGGFLSRALQYISLCTFRSQSLLSVVCRASCIEQKGKPSSRKDPPLTGGRFLRA